ncbi:MAG: hypothetical protein A2600_02015 [Candidatus Lambdaproteobacteria bacterium RIFOXYD1_FULL_56_27]|uniref:Outer-membrane lipoprotein LolB n=1 Tax=Candidatus Lambdaproteobacteria bacterium RIFOXYD2_FULL_56_26 TaxID=1817773 RepID=A0A1F6GMR5_9PROT|nr:MAG: hypothetical protein A2557_12415 [Candidatus Lambdaproteobacteria bacterium RIFOXYD2_FULL_56_26]OGH05615.1 MAG: hypothetical protein A2426_04805 [Candidatus Lambdaproteobacteria bacterium RIFOXYC1_FULL_56_13]OGH08575.1 MAG: hypothetical protein A2600_02015 [Candidatus Lambdaproteobacteria bacterium RIFOXYD1_FULL_56_27]
MAPFRFLSLGLIALLLASCSPSSFVALERPPADFGFGAFLEIKPDLLVRCKASLTGPALQEAGDCRLWIGADRLRLEVSHPLAGLVWFVERGPTGGFWVDGQTGQRQTFDLDHPPLPWLGLEPVELKALVLGRSLAGHLGLEGGERPQTRQLALGDQQLQVSYPLWFKQSGLELPKVIELVVGQDRLKLVILELQLGRGEALALP